MSQNALTHVLQQLYDTIYGKSDKPMRFSEEELQNSLEDDKEEALPQQGFTGNQAQPSQVVKGRWPRWGGSHDAAQKDLPFTEEKVEPPTEHQPLSEEHINKKNYINMNLAYALKISKLPPTQHLGVVQKVNKVIDSFPAAAIDRFHANFNEWHIHPSVDDLSKWFWKEEPWTRGNQVGGAYTPSTGTIHIDHEPAKGDWSYMGKSPAEGIYAHEFTHAIDGKNLEYSRSPTWLAIWGAEINSIANSPSRYSRTDPSEGFAEFGRLLWTRPIPLQEIEAKYPMASQFFKNNNLWPSR